MEKHKAWPDLLREHRDAAVAASTGDIPSVRHRVQHAWRYAWWTVLHSGKESTRKAVKIENNMIYWANKTDCVLGGALTLGPRETVALAALIITHLYAVSSRQRSYGRLRCDEKKNKKSKEV